MRKQTHATAPSDGSLFAPTTDIGPRRKTIGPTTRVRPFVLRLADGNY